MTIFGAQHNPYAKDYPGEGPGMLLPGTQGLVQSSHIVWDFLSQFSNSKIDFLHLKWTF